MTHIPFNANKGFSIQEPPVTVINNVGNYSGGTGLFTGAVTASSFIGPCTGNAATATNVAYTGLTGTVPTWNQSTTGNAATVTNGAYKNVNNNFTALQTLTAGLKLEDAALNTTIFSQDNTTDLRLDINSYYVGIPGQFSWLRNFAGNTISIGDLDGYNFPMSTVWDCENGTITTVVDSSSIYIDSNEVSITGALTVTTATGNVTVANAMFADSLTITNQVKGETISTGSSLVIQGTGTATTTSTTQATLLSLSSATYSSVKYFIQARNTTTSRFQITEIVATRNATTTVVTATPVDTNTGGIACTYAVDISASNFRLRITPQAASSTVFKVHYTAIP